MNVFVLVYETSCQMFLAQLEVLMLHERTTKTFPASLAQLVPHPVKVVKICHAAHTSQAKRGFSLSNELLEFVERYISLRTPIVILVTPQ